MTYIEDQLLFNEGDKVLLPNDLNWGHTVGVVRKVHLVEEDEYNNVRYDVEWQTPNGPQWSFQITLHVDGHSVTTPQLWAARFDGIREDECQLLAMDINTVPDDWTRRRWKRLLNRMRSKGWVVRNDACWVLTERGRDAAAHVKSMALVLLLRGATRDTERGER